MDMKNWKSAFTILGIIFLYFTINGCFVIGTAIGSSIEKKQDAKRPIVMPELDAINELEVGTWVEIVRMDGKKIEGRYLEANADTIPILKIKMSERKANQMIMLKDIDHILVGYKSEGPKFLGTFLGLTVDGIVWTIIAVAINNAISP